MSRLWLVLLVGRVFAGYFVEVSQHLSFDLLLVLHLLLDGPPRGVDDVVRRAFVPRRPGAHHLLEAAHLAERRTVSVARGSSHQVLDVASEVDDLSESVAFQRVHLALRVRLVAVFVQVDDHPTARVDEAPSPIAQLRHAFAHLELHLPKVRPSEVFHHSRDAHPRGFDDDVVEGVEAEPGLGGDDASA